MGSKRRRARLAKGIDHFKSVEERVHTLQFYDIKWLQGQVKAACRFSREINNVLAIYEEDFRNDLKDALKEVLDADDQPTC